jgi:hypothetical protein
MSTPWSVCARALRRCCVRCSNSHVLETVCASKFAEADMVLFSAEGLLLPLYVLSYFTLKFCVSKVAVVFVMF